jgi:hypothetical protein
MCVIDNNNHNIGRTMSADQIWDAIQQLAPNRAEEIREAYCDAVAGLQNLVTALEIADSECSTPDMNLLLTEHLLNCEALAVMNRSQLGKVL